MYDAIQVLTDAFLRLQRKKPEIIRSSMRRIVNLNHTKVLDCNLEKQISPFEHGEKISRMIKKVRDPVELSTHYESLCLLL